LLFFLQCEVKRLAHHVDPGIERQDRYRRVTGPPCEIGDTAADKA
jgi:hypothetical protein